jgi:AraC-like DNA-binding protein
MAKEAGRAQAHEGLAHLSCVRRLLHVFERRGVTPLSLLAQSGLERSADLIENGNFTEPEREHWVPIEQVFAVWDRALALDPDGGFFQDLTALLPAPALGTLGFQMLTAPTLLHSLQHLARGFELLTNSGRWEEHQNAEGTTFVWQRRAKSVGESAANEAIFAHVVCVLSDVAGFAVAPSVVRFEHRAGRTARTLSQLLPTAIEHDGRENSLAFPHAVLEARPRLAHEAMAVYFDKQVRARLELIRSTFGVVEALRRAFFKERVLGADSLCAASDRLNMSARTLQRRLEEAGTSFSVELERARRERAFCLVTTTSRSLLEVAKELGFADSSTFSRAFRRWYSVQPSVLRREGEASRELARFNDYRASG